MNQRGRDRNRRTKKDFIIKRLIAFGCSFTTGHGLSDIHVPEDLTEEFTDVSQFSWANVLADMCDVPRVIKAYPGSSNKRMAHDALTFDYQAGDHVFILWTSTARTCVLESSEKARMMMPNIVEYASYYTKFYEDYDCIFMDTLYKKAVTQYLKERGIKYTFSYFSKDDNPIDEGLYHKEYCIKFGRCDGWHGSQEAHYNFAKDIYAGLAQ